MRNSYIDTLSGEAVAFYKDKLEVVGLSDCGAVVDYVIGTLSELNRTRTKSSQKRRDVVLVSTSRSRDHLETY